MSIPNLRAIRDWCKEKISGVEKSLVINDVQLYLDYQDGKYGVNTDPERGTDTFTPFITSGEGSGGGGTSGTTPEQPDNPPQEGEEVKQLIKSTMSVAITDRLGGDVEGGKFSYYLEDVTIDKIESIHINELILEAARYTAGYTMSVNAVLIYQKNGEDYKHVLGSYDVTSSQFNTVILLSDYDVMLSDLVGAEKITKFYLECIPPLANSVSYCTYLAQLNIDAVIKYKGI